MSRIINDERATRFAKVVGKYHKIHRLKENPEYFEAVTCNVKHFEVRKNDRNFNVGDIIILDEYDNIKEEYTDRHTVFRITYILNNKEYCKDGYIILSIQEFAIYE